MLTIGKVAQRAGIRPSAIRYYEREGVLRPAHRLPNGYRVYGEEAVASLQFVRRAQALGITLGEAKQLLQVAQQGRLPCIHVQELARRHLRDVTTKIRELELLRSQLRRLLRRRVRRYRHGNICPMIEAVDSHGASAPRI